MSAKKVMNRELKGLFINHLLLNFPGSWWFQRFKHGHESVESDKCPGQRPVRNETDRNVEIVRAVAKGNR